MPPSVLFCEFPASELVPLLHQGGRPRRPFTAEEASRAPAYDLAVLGADTYQPGPELLGPVDVLRVPFDDIDGTPPQLPQIRAAAERVALELRCGRRVLVTCEQGRNRSGLVSALALLLVRPDRTAEQAIGFIRRARPNALTNIAFCRLIDDFGRQRQQPRPSFDARRPMALAPSIVLR